MSDTKSSKLGHGLAKGLGIDLNETRSPNFHHDSIEDPHSHTYVEPEPTAGDWFREHAPTTRQAVEYFYNLFPFLAWIMSYNVQWLIGDLVAGITVGAVVVPQGMAYAILAELPPEYGLYTSFMGVLIYWFFATSKDITIGPVAVMSTLVGGIIISTKENHPELEGTDIASALAIICGAIVTFLGFIRFGFIVDFIPLPAITAFMTGSAISICAGQVKTLLGETAKFSTRGATYRVIIDTLKHLPSATMDASMGMTALAMLYGIRSACNFVARRNPQRAKVFFFISTLRTAFVILFYTMISAAVNLHRRDDPAFKILGEVPRGFTHAKVPRVDTEIIRAFANEIPAAVIVLLIEHIAISKSFGRVNNYTINPSQEFIAIGITNLLGPFLGAYPATGSFSRTAIKSKSGVRTPLAGVITAVVVLLAIYALPAVFFYIPSASLAGVIIHAVGDLITPPSVTYQFWRVAPLDAIIFLAGVIIIIFTEIEIGIYCTICVSAAVLLFRLAKARGQFMGRVRIHSVIGDHLLEDDEDPYAISPRTIYLPTTHSDGSNPDVKVEQPSPGIFIYRLSDGLNYPNANHYTDHLVDHIFKTTRRTTQDIYESPGDRPWNDPAPRRSKAKANIDNTSHLPTLKAVILDFSSVNNVDVTSIQNLIDVRNQLDRYATPDKVQWHFAHINNKWTKRALVAGGFGFPPSVSNSEGSQQPWKAIFTVAEVDGSPDLVTNKRNPDLESGSDDIDNTLPSKQYPQATERSIQSQTLGIEKEQLSDVPSRDGSTVAERRETGNNRKRILGTMAVVEGINRPFFHIDITSALQSAVANSHRSSGSELDASK
ncbi:putative sulfate transporter [Aspergillus steynii IBT 23096]|uniref:Putative sulfate transporter n=1 Tax=Aspergillus steynii IBT 23096 TaxID=1392250 RepID=A0A2I2GLG3_9EURO|nr:putative sulfate transporter [Aspergillus steynii IBT 23096]PLB53713.1 putative sulfate transporter [Aspergillus steynii IBT 23096]